MTFQEARELVVGFSAYAGLGVIWLLAILLETAALQVVLAKTPFPRALTNAYLMNALTSPAGLFLVPVVAYSDAPWPDVVGAFAVTTLVHCVVLQIRERSNRFRLILVAALANLLAEVPVLLLTMRFLGLPNRNDDVIVQGPVLDMLSAWLEKPLAGVVVLPLAAGLFVLTLSGALAVLGWGSWRRSLWAACGAFVLFVPASFLSGLLESVAPNVLYAPLIFPLILIVAAGAIPAILNRQRGAEAVVAALVHTSLWVYPMMVLGLFLVILIV